MCWRNEEESVYELCESVFFIIDVISDGPGRRKIRQALLKVKVVSKSSFSHGPGRRKVWDGFLK
jgi:hypothetical protein